MTCQKYIILRGRRVAFSKWLNPKATKCITYFQAMMCIWVWRQFQILSVFHNIKFHVEVTIKFSKNP